MVFILMSIITIVIWYAIAYWVERKNLCTVRDFICPLYRQYNGDFSAFFWIYIPIANYMISIVLVLLIICVWLHDNIHIKKYIDRVLDYKIIKRGK